MTIKELKKELNLIDKDIAKILSLTLDGYKNSSAKKRYDDALCKFYEIVKMKLFNL